MYSVDKNETKENKIMILESLDNLQLAFGCLKFNRFMGRLEGYRSHAVECVHAFAPY